MRPIFVVVVVAFIVGAAAAHAAPFSVVVSARELVFSGVTPGGEVALVGLCGQTIRGMLTKQQFAEVLADGDRDGIITYAPNGGVPFRSIWVAADVTSGASAVATPDGYVPKHHAVAARALKKDAEGFVTTLELERLDVTLLLVRPGVGAWLLHGREGEEGDGDRARDGRLSLVVGEASPLGSGKERAPQKLKAGDFVAVLDRARFDIRTLAVTR